MDRREFIQVMLPIAGLPVVWPMWSFAKPIKNYRKSLEPFNFPDDGRVLVLVQIAGGNDGLNTIVPYRNDIYYRSRPQLAIPRSNIIDINGNIGFNNVLADLEPLYDAGHLAIVQGVGYPNPDRSHFRSTDIWLTGSSSEEVAKTGWLGRYFDQICPEGEQCGTFGPPAIQIGLTSSLALLGREQKGIALQNPVQFYELVNRLGNSHNPQPVVEPITPAEKELEFLRQTEATAFQFAGEIVEANERNENQVDYPPNQSLAQQLSIVARLIAGGLSTRVYIVSMSGFDTHANQANIHRILLEQLSTGISLFQKDLEMLGVADRVVGFCFSEFGRRVSQNASGGTDHGTSAPLFLFGHPVNGGVHGAHPSLTDLEAGDLKHHIDYREIYATLLEQWLTGKADSILGEEFTTLPLIDLDTKIKEPPKIPGEIYLSQNYPNPFNPQTTIEYGLPHSMHVKLVIMNSLGQEVAVLANEQQSAGINRVNWNGDGYASGTYFFQMKTERFQRTRRMTLIK